jgi:hypothetical protein
MSSQYDGEESCKLRSATMPDGRTPEPGGWNRIHFDVEDIASEVQRLKGTEVNFRNEIVTVAGMLRHVCVADEAMRGRVSEPEGLVCLGCPNSCQHPGALGTYLCTGPPTSGTDGPHCGQVTVRRDIRWTSLSDRAAAGRVLLFAHKQGSQVACKTDRPHVCGVGTPTAAPAAATSCIRGLILGDRRGECLRH